MKSSFILRLPLMVALAMLALFATVKVSAQTVPGSAALTWTNPTTSAEGVPLTGANAITGIEVHWATAPIADTDLTRAPQVTLTGSPSTTQQTIQVANGSTLYFRLRAVRSTDNSKSAFSNQASKVIALSTVPNPPTNLQITITITADGSIVIEPVEAAA